VVAGVDEAQHAFRGRAFQGVLVDFPTLLREKPEAKAFFYDLQEILPVVRLRYDREQDRPLAFATGRASGVVDFEQVVRTEVCTAPPRTLRHHRRAPVYISVRLRRAGAGDDTPWLRVATVNVSAGGCCLACSEDFAVGDRVELWFCEWMPEAPVLGTIRWRVPWGASLKLPSVGVALDDVAPQRYEELDRWIKAAEHVSRP
jgi:hypothetical protein